MQKMDVDGHANTTQRNQMNWFDSIVTLENMTKSFNLSNMGEQSSDSEESKPRHIPLCISDLLQRLLLSKVDKTVDQYVKIIVFSGLAIV